MPQALCCEQTSLLLCRHVAVDVCVNVAKRDERFPEQARVEPRACPFIDLPLAAQAIRAKKQLNAQSMQMK